MADETPTTSPLSVDATNSDVLVQANIPSVERLLRHQRVNDAKSMSEHAERRNGASPLSRSHQQHDNYQPQNAMDDESYDAQQLAAGAGMMLRSRITTPSSGPLIAGKFSGHRRATCHRCANVRKRNVVCPKCPRIVCEVCAVKWVSEHGKDAFDDGCPICKQLCCCADPPTAVSCARLYHCNRRVSVQSICSYSITPNADPLTPETMIAVSGVKKCGWRGHCHRVIRGGCVGAAPPPASGTACPSVYHRCSYDHGPVSQFLGGSAPGRTCGLNNQSKAQHWSLGTYPGVGS
jgi:hypothetical protein